VYIRWSCEISVHLPYWIHRPKSRFAHRPPNRSRCTEFSTSWETVRSVTEVVVANHDSTQFCYYISMVNTATITILRTWPPKSRSRRRPSRRRRRFGRPAVHDLADLPRRRSGSMPNIAVRFTSIENVPAWVSIETFDLTWKQPD